LEVKKSSPYKINYTLYLTKPNFTKTKAIFPTDDSIRKAIYMSAKEISKKWTMPVRDWGLAYAQFLIFFEDRFAA